MYKFNHKSISSNELFAVCFLSPSLQVKATNQSDFKSYYRVIIQGFLDMQTGSKLERYNQMIDMNEQLIFSPAERVFSVQAQDKSFWLVDSISNIRWYGFDWIKMLYYGSFLLHSEIILTEEQYRTMRLLGKHTHYTKI